MIKKKARALDDTRGTSSDFGTVGSASTGSYDTTEDLTDTDTSSNPNRQRSSPDGKNRVRFSIKANKVHKVASHNDFSAKERGNYWWSDREKDRMMAKHERLVAKYEQTRAGTKPGSKKISTGKLGSYRGLESWTAAGSLKLDHTIEQCITAVMDEQDRQWNENDDDLEVIAQKSKAVTEDSARRARLNGLQDAQESLRIRGESWSKLNAGDEISVGSAVSTGTAAVAKKKKRSKLLARLDDSGKAHKRSSSSDTDDVLQDLKKTQKKKKKKAKKSKKDKDKKAKSKKGRESDDGDTTDTKTTLPTTVASHLETPLKNVTVPVSPLATPETSSDVHPLLATLRQEQEKLRESSTRSGENNSTRSREGSMKSIYDRVHIAQSVSASDTDNDEHDIVKLLREQQRKNAMAWTSDQGGNAGIPARSGAPVSKLASLREDYTKTDQAKYSDPPGRRPRRLASQQGANVSSTPKDKKRRERNNRSSDPPLEDESPAVEDNKSRPSFLKGGIMNAKALFKKRGEV
mmetsp:Transcript_3573/g.8535  ORF Transcript_3573/g.8535 Transcript_3573/m.8535 type:complete len:519 (-) Transcript_3573:385-1941(-)